MAISGISTVLNVFNPPNLEKAAEEMKKDPEAAESALGKLLECITNEGRELGVGFTGKRALDAGVLLRQLVGSGKGSAVAGASKSQLAKTLLFLGPLRDSFNKQMETVTHDQRRVELLQKMIRMTENLQRFSAPEKLSDP